MTQEETAKRHAFDDWFWCRRCGLGQSEVVNRHLACDPPDAATLATIHLEHIQRRLPLVQAANYVISRLQDDGVIS